MQKLRDRMFFLLFFLTGYIATTAQNVEVLRSSSFVPGVKSKEFAFLEPATDTSSLKFIASLKMSGDEQTGIQYLYDSIRINALALGANCFKLNKFVEYGNKDSTSLTLNVYYATDALLYINFQNHPKNVTYIFESPYKSDHICRFYVDDVKKKIKDGTYYLLKNKSGKEIEVAKAAVDGVSVFIRGSEGKPAAFLALSGFKVTGVHLLGGPHLGPLQIVGGQMEYVNGNLGHLIISLMTPSEQQ